MQTWGAWAWEQQLLEQMLTWLPEHSLQAVSVTAQLGNIAQLRGDLERAEAAHRAAIPMFEELGDRAGMGSSYHQLGRLAQDRGEYPAAEEWYRRSLAIDEELGDRAGVGRSYHQLGRLAELQGEYP